MSDPLLHPFLDFSDCFDDFEGVLSVWAPLHSTEHSFDLKNDRRLDAETGIFLFGNYYHLGRVWTVHV